jgi:hypothetical protein
MYRHFKKNITLIIIICLILQDDKLKFKKGEIYIASDILAKELDRKHQTIYNLIKVYKKEIETLGVLVFEIRKPTKEW